MFKVKTCVRHFSFLHQMISLKKLRKSFFRSQDILIFIFPSSLLFPSVSHCSRRFSKLNLKVYDVTNLLNKNFIKIKKKLPKGDERILFRLWTIFCTQYLTLCFCSFIFNISYFFHVSSILLLKIQCPEI